MQPRHMGAYPDSDIRRHIEVSGKRIQLVLIDWRAPVKRCRSKRRRPESAHSASDSSAPGGDAASPRARPPRVRSAGSRGVLVAIASLPGLWNGSFPAALLRVAAGCGDELKDLVRRQRSVRQFPGRRIDDIADAQGYLFFCDQHNRNAGRY
jgi:hypothetical protein